MDTHEHLKRTAIGVIGGFIINIAGWFVVHFLTKRREAEKEKKSQDDFAAKERKRIEAANHLTDCQRDILQKCVATDGFERVHVWVMHVDASGRGYELANMILWTKRTPQFRQSISTLSSRYLIEDIFATKVARCFISREQGLREQSRKYEM